MCDGDHQIGRYEKGSNQLGFARESGGTVSVPCELFGQNLYGYIAAKFAVPCLIDLTHTAFTQLRCDFVMCECFPDHGYKSLRAKLTCMLSGDS